MKKINLHVFYFLFLVLIISGCGKVQKKESIGSSLKTIASENVSALTPVQVVILYFKAWNDEHYEVMYSLISDGFKQIEPTAKSPEEFTSYMSKFFDNALGVMARDAKESYNNGKEAGVHYKIEIKTKDGAIKEFSSTYTLKQRTNGWKLIHPYGEKIDAT